MGFVRALREARAVSPASATRSVPHNGRARPTAANPPAAGAAPRARQPSLWERLVGLVQEALRGALDLLRTGLDHLLRTLSGR